MVTICLHHYGAIDSQYDLLYSSCMSTYIRPPLGFKEHLAEIAEARSAETDAKPKRKHTLNMSRLADELKKSLTPLQNGSLSAALMTRRGLPAGAGLPAVIARANSALTISQRNAVLALAICNDIEVLAAFFDEVADGMAMPV